MLTLWNLLPWPFTEHFFACWSQFHACNHVMAMHNVHLRVCKLCPLCKHMSHSHMRLYALSRKHHRCHQMIYHKCHACRSHRRSLTLSVCFLDGLRCLVINSCWVCVREVMHVQSHSSSHLVILLKLYRPDHPPTIKHPLRCIEQFQLSVIMYCSPELRKAWGYHPDSLHYAILE